MKNFKILSFLLSLVLIFFYACSVDLVEPSASGTVQNRLDEDCQFIMTGQVLDAKNRMPIMDARVLSDDLNIDVMSDEEGRFMFEIPFPIENFFGSRKHIEVTKDGYVLSTLEIDFTQFYFQTTECEDSYTEVELDFVLTKEQTCHTVEPDGSSFMVYDTTFISNATGANLPVFDFMETTQDTVIREFRVTAPAGAVDVPTDICVTPISDDQYLGLFQEMTEVINDQQFDYGSPIVRFDFQPDGQVFNSNLSISFKTIGDEISAGDNLDYYVRNPLTNIWEIDGTADITYNASTREVRLRTNHFSQGLILNSSARIEVNEVAFSAPQIIRNSQTFNTCNCTDSLNIEFNEDIQLVNEEFSLETSSSNEMRLLQKLRALKTILNIAAASSSGHLEYFAADSNMDFPTLRVYDERTVDIEGRIFKCEITVITVAVQYETLEGFFDDVAFSYKSFAGLVVTSPQISCPVTSLCHQGCPE